MVKENIFNFSEEQLKKNRKMMKQNKTSIIGYNENQFGEAMVTTGVPVQIQPDSVSYTKVRTVSYEKYMFDYQQKMAKRR